MLLRELVDTSAAVAGAAGRNRKVELLSDLLRRVPREELEPVVSYLAGSPLQGRIGMGFAAIRAATPDRAAGEATLEVADVHGAFAAIAGTRGPGSTGTRSRLLRDLLLRATRSEQEFLVRLLLGELRQGALDAVVLEAVARATGIAAGDLRLAAMRAGDLVPAATAAMTGGREALGRFALRPFGPVQPMLAQAAADAGEALEHLGQAELEWKLDGGRIQVHREGDEVRVYSRTLRDVTAAVPEVVETARALPARSLILDGEVLALRPDGSPFPFQTTMRRFGRRLDVEQLRSELPLSPFLFDLLYLDGGDLTGEPQRRRFGELVRLAPSVVVPHATASTVEEVERFFAAALARGHEGLVAKAGDAAYEAGRRGGSWLKLKPAPTLDLVVLAVEWGSGRRRGLLSNLHLGARDPRTGGFVMLGKTFKGLTDEMLRWQTERLSALATAHEEHVVHVRPELVVEIAYGDLQASPRYPAGVALRFARVKRHRDDKPASEADTIDTVLALFRRQTGTS